MAIVPFRINLNEISIFGKSGFDDADNLRKFLNQEFTNYFVQTRKFTILDREFDKEIASKAIKKKTGARGLRSILENILLKTMYDLPSQDNIEEVIIDAGAAKGQSQPILVHSKGENKSKSGKTSAA